MSALIDRQRAKGLELVNAPDERARATRRRSSRAFCRAASTSSPSAAATARSRRPPAAWPGSDVPLAVLPGGTSNVLAIELGIPTRPRCAPRPCCSTASRAPLRLAHADGRPFLLWAGVGLDARVMGKMSLAWKRLARPRRDLPDGRVAVPPVRVPEPRGGDRRRRPRGDLRRRLRARHYAGEWVIAPDADPVGDTFDVLLFAERSHARLAQLFQQMAAGRAGHLKDGLARIVRGPQGLHPLARRKSRRGPGGRRLRPRRRRSPATSATETVRVLVPATD